MTDTYWSNDACSIYNDDNSNVLPGIANKSFDVIVTDPPYNDINWHKSAGLRKLDKGVADSGYVDVAQMAPQFARIARHCVYVWVGWPQLSDWVAGFRAAGMSGIRVGVWHKTNPSPMNGTRLWLSGLEFCVYARHPKAYYNRHCVSPIWTGPTQRLRTSIDHPTPKPVWLMQELLDASCPPGGSVLDPYMGSGSTLVAATQLGMTSTGIDYTTDYCRCAVDRIEGLK